VTKEKVTKEKTPTSKPSE